MNKNVFSGEDSVKDYLNPDKSLPLPLVELPESLNPFRNRGVRIYVKMLSHLPLLNIKSLPAFNMMIEAEKRGDLEGKEAIIENSSGNTVTSLAVIGRLLGIDNTRAYVSNQVTGGKLDLLRFAGIKPVVSKEPICPDPSDPNSGIHKAKQDALKNNWYNPGQYDNEDNPGAHYKWTGPQIYEQMDGNIQVVAVSLGTTGTTFAAKYIKDKSPDTVSLGVLRALHNPIPGPRTKSLLREIHFDWKENIDLEEEVITKDAYEESLEMSRYGLMVGPSTGMTLAGVKHYINKQIGLGELDSIRNKDGEVNIVMVACDTPVPYIKEYFKYCSIDKFPSIENEELLDIYTQGSDGSTEVKVESLSVNEAYNAIYNMKPDQLWKSLNSGQNIMLQENVEIIDLRVEALYEHAHLPSSQICRSFKLEEMEQCLDKLNLSYDKRYFLICTYGDKSEVFGKLLVEKGYKTVNISGGFKEWLRMDLPVKRSSFCNRFNNETYKNLLN